MPNEDYANLRDRLRGYIGDPAGTSQQFSDDELDVFIDGARLDMRFFQLAYALVPSMAGADVFYSPFGDWTGDTILVDPSGNAVTPDEVDLVAGRWVFTAPRAYPLYVTGASVDLAAAAEKALTAWASRVKEQHDLATSGLSLTRSQKHMMLLQQASYFAKKKRVVSVPVVTT